MVNKPLIGPYFWGGGRSGGGWLIRHKRWVTSKKNLGSILRRHADILEVLATSGDPHLGGRMTLKPWWFWALKCVWNTKHLWKKHERHERIMGYMSDSLQFIPAHSSHVFLVYSNSGIVKLTSMVHRSNTWPWLDGLPRNSSRWIYMSNISPKWENVVLFLDHHSY